MSSLPPDQQPQTIRAALTHDLKGDIKQAGLEAGVLLFQILGILGLIVLGACVCGAGLFFQIWIVAIIGGVLIGAGILWAIVLLFLTVGAYL